MKTYKERFFVEVEREEYSDRLVSVAYHDESGRLHRTFDQPARVVYDSATGNVRQVLYAEHGEEHRQGEKPSFQEIDPFTGVIRYERKSERGTWRKDGVSVVERDEKTGRIISVVGRKNGKQFVENFPSSDGPDNPDWEP